MTGLSVEATELAASLRNLAFCAENSHQVNAESAQVCLYSEVVVARAFRLSQASAKLLCRAHGYSCRCFWKYKVLQTLVLCTRLRGCKDYVNKS